MSSSLGNTQLLVGRAAAYTSNYAGDISGSLFVGGDASLNGNLFALYATLGYTVAAITNSNFSSPSLTTNTYSNTAPTGWTFNTNGANGNNIAQVNGTDPFSFATPPNGTYYVRIQHQTNTANIPASVSQSVFLPRDVYP